MKRIIFTILFFSISVSFMHALEIENSISPKLELSKNDTDIIDKINEYNVRQILANEYLKINKMAQDKVYFEGHLGMSGNYFAGGSDTYNILKGLNTNTTSINMNLLLKFNLVNPKMPYYNNYLISEIRYLEELIQQYGFTLSDSASKQLESLKKEIKTYQEQFWYKRISLGIGFPFNILLDSGTFFNQDNNTNHTVDLYNSLFATQDIFFFVGYDLGDYVTLELGSNIYLNRIFLGVSIDITTPMYLSSSRFFDFLSRTFGKNRPQTLTIVN